MNIKINEEIRIILRRFAGRLEIKNADDIE